MKFSGLTDKISGGSRKHAKRTNQSKVNNEMVLKMR